MTQGPRQRRDRPFVRAAGFLVTVMVQIISRIPPTSSDSLMTIPPPVIGIQDGSTPGSAGHPAAQPPISMGCPGRASHPPCDEAVTGWLCDTFLIGTRFP